MLTLALLVAGVGVANATKLYATYGTPAGNGTWNAETGQYSWTNSSNNLMDLFTFGSGELASYNSLHFTTSECVDGPYRICFMNGSTAVATIAFYSEGQKDLSFSERTETKDLDLSQITSIKFGGASSAGSIKITSKPYLEKPMQLVWNDNGEAEIALTDLTATGGFSLNDQTGELTGTGESGSLSINFPTGGVDLTNLTGFSVTFTGDNLFNNFEIGNGTTNKGFWSNVTGRNDLNQYMTVSDVGDPTAITRWRWYNNSTASTMTISSIKLKAEVMTAHNPHETLLTTAMYTGYPESHFGETMGQGATIYGMGNNIDGTQYVDLSDYDEMHIYGTANKQVRFLFNWTSGNQIDQTITLDAKGFSSYDLTALTAQQLNAVKFPWDGQNGVVEKIILYKKSILVDYSYVISGAGAVSSSVTAALADATATSIDATGLSAATELISANPNCLFVANDGMVTNSKNVIVGGTCANLELTDGHPFKAPADFTATSATYTTTISAAGAATLCLPFAATIPAGVTAYTLNYTSGSNATATPVETTIPANTPVLLNGSDDVTFAGSGAIDADATNTAEALTGVFASATVPTGSYVLQDGEDGVGFYKVGAGDPITINPFRAYLTASTGGVHSLTVDYENGEETGIKSVDNGQLTKDNAIYNLSGMRVVAPTKGLYIVNGKKVVK